MRREPVYGNKSNSPWLRARQSKYFSINVSGPSGDRLKDGLIEVFTDGACRGNPGPGGWAALMRVDGHEKLINGATMNTTNNRMELLAAIEGLAALKGRRQVRLTTDSQYVRRGITQWLRQWKINGWKTSGKRSVKNRDLWERLDTLADHHDIEWLWVKGHSGHIENERVDHAANIAIDEMLAS